ncbi:MAG: amino acid adenylation domain-containing protein [Pseudomonadota bacterium]
MLNTARAMDQLTEMSLTVREILVDFVMLDEASEISDRDAFADLGISSVQAMEVRVALEQRLGRPVPNTALFECPTVGDLASFLVDRPRAGQQQAQEAASQASVQEPLDQETDSRVAILAEATRFAESDASETLWQRALDGATLQARSFSPHTTLGYGKVKLPSSDESAIQQLGLRVVGAEALLKCKPVFAALDIVAQALQRYRIAKDLLTSHRVGVFAAAETGAAGRSVVNLPLANAVSYLLDLKGPSETVSALCASSFVAVHRAVRSLREGECELAIVLGTSFVDDGQFYAAAARGDYAELLDPTNVVRSFSNDAEGFVRAEGVGALVLASPRLTECAELAPLAWVLGTAAAHGGRSYSLEAPNARAIRATVEACLDDARVCSDQLDCIEAHGIGNPLADTIELSALDAALSARSAKTGKTWSIGSVKPNVGHPEIASGFAALVKAIHALRAGIIPGLAGYAPQTSQLNDFPHLAAAATPSPWQRDGDEPRMVGLNSYAIGGMTTHLVLSEAAQGPAATVSMPLASGSPSEEVATEEPFHYLQYLTESTLATVNDIAQEALGRPLEALDPDKSPIDYGFDSIAVVRFCQGVNDKLGLELKLGELLGLSSFQELAEFLGGRLQSALPMRSTLDPTRFDQDEDSLVLLPLSEIQKGLWLVQETQPANTSFNVPIFQRADRGLEIGLLCAALAVCLQSFPALRMRFIQDDDMRAVAQAVRRDITPYLDIEQSSFTTKDEMLAQAWERLRTPLDLAHDPLLRTFLFTQESAPTAYLLFVVHHIVIDGFSAVQFLKTFWNTYERLSRGTPAQEIPIRRELGFARYLEWEESYIGSDKADADLEWWKAQLHGSILDVRLPCDREKGSDTVLDASRVGVGSRSFFLHGEEVEGLRRLAKANRNFLSVVLLAAFGVLVRALTRLDEIPVVTPLGGRPDRSFASSVGCFINLVVTRLRVEPDASFTALLKEVKSAFTGAVKHGQYPFPLVGAKLGLGLMKTTNKSLPLGFTYQNIFDELPREAYAALAIEPTYEMYQESDDQYALEVVDERHRIEVKLKYQRALFDDETIERHLRYLGAILRQVQAEPDTLVRDLSFLAADERRFLLGRHGPSRAGDWVDRTVLDRFHEQAERAGEAVAIVDGDRQLSYRQLQAHIRGAAQRIASHGADAGQLVIVAMPRSLEAVIYMLGVLEAGCAFLPIDPALGAERIRSIAEQSQAALALTLASNPTLDAVLPTCVVALPERAPAADQASGRRRANDTAYIMYTSGSTGQPKGVAIDQVALTNLSLHIAQQYEVTSEDRVMLSAPLYFDMSIEEIFPYLISGAGIVVRPDTELRPDRLAALITTQRISVLNITPSFYGLIETLDDAQQSKLFESVRIVAFGGEALPAATRSHAQRFPVRIFNAYGPTEYTVNASITELVEGQPLSIGEPLSHTQLLVLDEALALVPIGVWGELHITGLGLAQGYLGQSELTERSFVANPYGEGRLYKTGDRVRWLADGRLEYGGRRDHQIKIRGHRIELGEVETTLAQMPGVSAAAAIYDPDRGGAITAFCAAAQPLAESALRGFAADRLPAYMQPGSYRTVSSLPMTTQGKVDRNALLVQSRVRTGRSFTAPRTPIEEIICEIWRQALSASRVGIDDDFFSLGGHSLLAVQVLSQLRTELGVEVPLGTFFELSSVRRIADYLHETESSQRKKRQGLNVLRSPCTTLIVPGLPGLSGGYYGLASMLRDGSEVLGLTMAGHDDTPALRSIRAMAEHNLQRLTQVKDRGKINIYAHSFGATVALEMLHQLREMPFEIGHVTFIDARLHEPLEHLSAPVVTNFIDLLVRMQPGRQGASPRLRAQVDAMVAGDPAGDSWPERLIQFLRAERVVVDRAFFRRAWAVVTAAATAQFVSPSTALPMDLRLIIAEQSRASLSPAPWQALFDSVRVDYAPGDHFSVAQSPHCSTWING